MTERNTDQTEPGNTPETSPEMQLEAVQDPALTEEYMNDPANGKVKLQDGRLTANELIPIYEMRITRMVESLKKKQFELTDEEFKKLQDRTAMEVFIASCTKTELERRVTRKTPTFPYPNTTRKQKRSKKPRH